ncbi:MAG TPA: hypothetical protein VLA90_06785 [Actinomycetota bacterium]|nr:hypothetical protein [Actinomycetota bacterium]
MLAKILIGWVALSVPVGLLLGRILRLGHHPLGHGHVRPADPVRTAQAHRAARSA